MTLRLPDPCLVVLVGATGAGKSHWAAEWFGADQVVSSDRLRAVVGTGERDQRASRDAFEVLDLIVGKRLRRGLTTVIDSTGLEARRRGAWRALAEARTACPRSRSSSTPPRRSSASATAPARRRCRPRS